MENDFRQQEDGGRRTRDCARDCVPEMPFATLLYRFLFFDWLFADMAKATNRFERHASWQHNRSMRKYLPIYFRRWCALTVLAFGLGGLFERVLQTSMLAAWCYTWSCITVTGIVIISVSWIFLSRTEMP
ncbi:hypothetical protein BH11PSE11_BH11PSE11_02660 [soil metagenome]